MVVYLIIAVIWAGFSASAYWNDHALMAVLFAAMAGSTSTAASLSSRMDNIDAMIEKKVDRIWDAIQDLKDRL
jgi:hypothetical protein